MVFPRTKKQAVLLNPVLHGGVSLALLLAVPEEELKERLRRRGTEQARTDDRDEDKIQHRLRVYRAETQPVSDYYARAEKLFRIDGTGSVAEITGRIVVRVDAFLSRQKT